MKSSHIDLAVLLVLIAVVLLATIWAAFDGLGVN
jgi:Flp pilus assembly pilin Flp